MLRFLSSRETGEDNPILLQRAETTRRSYSLDLSRYRDVEQVSHSSSVNCLDIDLVEDRYLLSGGSNGMIFVYDLYNGTKDVKYSCNIVASVGLSNNDRHRCSIETVQWYPLDTGMFITSGTDRLLKIWDTNNLVVADHYEFKGIIYCHHLSSVAQQHSLIAVGYTGSSLKLIDMKSGSATHSLRGHQKPVQCVQWSPKDEFILASGSTDGQVLLWDIRRAKGSLMKMDQFNGEGLSNSKDTHVFAHDGHVNGLQFTTDGLLLVTLGTDQCIRLWSTASGRNTLVNYGKINNMSRRCVKISVSHNGSPDVIFIPEGSDINIYNIFSGSKIDVLRGHYNQVNCCKFQRNYQELYSGGNDRNILIWVPNTDDAYEEHLRTISCQKRPQARTQSFNQKTALPTADTWSSDED
ncbi:DNA excision repair protein ERCC-8 [Octopus sinensis]|uniref:DNA excision repair protein ERCC-8 n=1 Tax=Octopus sinensis TaxID=2607531 RepID=A0A6P7TGG2_9MOLL|nr:DNA excision repair protein ERCC-8 [Octopus sinensis]